MALSTSSVSARSTRIFTRTESPRATARAICRSQPWSRLEKPVTASSRSRNAPPVGSSTISTKGRCAACCPPSSPRSMRPAGSICPCQPATASGALTGMLRMRHGARCCLPSLRTGQEERTHGWRERLVASPTGSGPFDDALARLDALIPDGAVERHLIHSDLLNFNVLVEGGRISAVIDWAAQCTGIFSTTSPGSSSGRPGTRPGTGSIFAARLPATMRQLVSLCRVSRNA